MIEGFCRRIGPGAIVSLAALVASQPALAVCMPTTSTANGSAGPPAISATEASTTETLDKIRERREEIVTTSSATMAAASASQASATAEAESEPAQASKPSAPKKAKTAKAAVEDEAPAPKKKAKAASSESAPAEAAPVADDGLNGQGVARAGSYGAWALGFVDYERHSNLAPGQQANPTRKTTTGGGLAGMDWSVVNRGAVTSGVQVGVFGGYSHSKGKFSDTTGPQTVNEPRVGDPTLVPVPYTVSTSNSEQTTEGGILGLYGSYFHGGFSADAAFKVDIFDYSRSADVVQRKPTLVEDNGDPTVCAAGTREFTQRLAGSTDQTDYIFAGNLNYKYDLSGGFWLEPTAGLRYTYTDFGTGAGALGLTNGEAFRIQGGVRLGTTRFLEGGAIWTTVLSGILYSDVMINGFNVTNATFPATFAAVDEGKLRVLGSLQTALDAGDGMTYFGEVNVRGGEDVFGVGGLAGIRYNW